MVLTEKNRANMEDKADQCKALDDSFCGVSELLANKHNPTKYFQSESGTLASNYADRYSDASATWVVSCAILMFFMVRALINRLIPPFVYTKCNKNKRI